MAERKAIVRQSVTLPPRVASRIRELAKRQRRSANRVIVELVETGLETRDRERKLFFELADRLVHTTDVSEQKRLKAELARLTFGE